MKSIIESPVALVVAVMLFIATLPIWVNMDHNHEANIASANVTNESAHVAVEWDQFDPETWMSVMQIWRCDDGTFEVRTDYTVWGRYGSADQARYEKTNWARIMVAIERKNRGEFVFPTPEKCGKRIE